MVRLADMTLKQLTNSPFLCCLTSARLRVLLARIKAGRAKNLIYNELLSRRTS